jgi:Beta2-adaptin appendage, C-terminal sub-domain
MLHCLIDTANPMKPEEFKKFWEMIPKTNESTFNVTKLYGGFNSGKFNGGDLASNLVDGLTSNGFVNVAKVPKKDSANTTMLYFGARTINNLPLLLEIPALAGSTSIQVLYRVPVPPLKPLLEDALAYILSDDNRGA